MPAAQTVASILKGAGFSESTVVHAEPGRKEANLAGFRVQASPIDRRVVHVYHVGKGAKMQLAKYGATLITAGYVITKVPGGLEVRTRRSMALRAEATCYPLPPDSAKPDSARSE